MGGRQPINLVRPPALCHARHFFWVDLIRGVAALAVLVWHYQAFYYGHTYHVPIDFHRNMQPFYQFLSLFYEYGHLAVPLFWVISGFVFASVYAHTEPTGRDFFVNRFARLYPLHFLTLLIVAGLQLVNLTQTGHYQIYPYNDAYHFGLHLFFASGWGFEQGYSFNAPIWSVSVEIVIYIVFWVVLRFVFSRGIMGPLLMTALFAALVAANIPGTLWLCGFYFFLGNVVYVWLVAFQGLKYANFALGVLGVAVTSILLWLDVKYVGYVALPVLFSSLVLLAASVDVMDVRQRGRQFSRLGDLTYGIYLLHIPVQLVLILLLEHFRMDRHLVSTEFFFVLFFGLVIGLSSLSFRYYELPMRHMIRERLRKPAALPSLSAANPTQT